MAKKTIMRAFKLNEISAVDRPAQAHARAVIMKRAPELVQIVSFENDGEFPGAMSLLKFTTPGTAGVVSAQTMATIVRKDMYGVSRFADLIQSINYLAQSAEMESEQEGDASPVPAALRSWLKTGTDVFRAMADEEVRELITAVSGYSKRKFNAAARRKDAKDGVAMKDGSFPIASAGDLANAMRLVGHAKDPAAARAHIRRRAKALGLEAKLGDDKAEKFAGAVNDALDTDLLAGVSPVELEKAILADLGDAQSKERNMTDETLDDQVAKKDSDQENADGDTKKPAFPKKKPAKNPDKTDDKDEGVEKAFDLPPEIKKALDENADLKKRLSTLEDEREGTAFGKRAVSLGLPETHGDVLRKAYKGDADAIVKLEAIIKGLTAQVESSKLFGEIGSVGKGAPNTAKAEIEQKASAYREGQIAIGKSLSPQQAFTKVYLDPANADLKKRYDAEEAATKR